MKGELYLGFGDVDLLALDIVIIDIRDALDKLEAPHHCNISPGTRHGFCFEERAVYNREAADEVWGKAFDILARRLS